MGAFATYADLSLRMNRTFTVPEQAWVTALLGDAADFMRGIMRAHVYPSVQSTYTAYPVHGRVDLPQSFIRSVDAVARGGVAVSYTRRQDSVFVASDAAVDVTFTHGLATPPGDLVGYNCALVSGQIMTVEAGLGLTAGGLSSVALDDFKAAFADAGGMTGLALPPHAENYLRETYGRSGFYVGGA